MSYISFWKILKSLYLWYIKMWFAVGYILFIVQSFQWVYSIRNFFLSGEEKFPFSPMLSSPQSLLLSLFEIPISQTLLCRVNDLLLFLSLTFSICPGMWETMVYVFFFLFKIYTGGEVIWGFLGSSNGEESACNAGDQGSVPGSGRSPGKGHGNSLQHSCLENPMDRGAWCVTVHRVTKSQTRLKRLNLAQHTPWEGLLLFIHSFIYMFTHSFNQCLLKSFSYWKYWMLKRC